MGRVGGYGGNQYPEIRTTIEHVRPYASRGIQTGALHKCIELANRPRYKDLRNMTPIRQSKTRPLPTRLARYPQLLHETGPCQLPSRQLGRWTRLSVPRMMIGQEQRPT